MNTFGFSIDSRSVSCRTTRFTWIIIEKQRHSAIVSAASYLRTVFSLQLSDAAGAAAAAAAAAAGCQAVIRLFFDKQLNEEINK